VFTSTRAPGSETEVSLMNADGSGRRTLTRTAAGKPPYTPAWSPDARQVAFVGSRDGYGIYVVNADGAGNEAAPNGSAPAYSPNGRKIAFVSGHTGDARDLYVMNATDRAAGLAQRLGVGPPGRRTGRSLTSERNETGGLRDQRGREKTAQADARRLGTHIRRGRPTAGRSSSRSAASRSTWETPRSTS
jgi:Tol biopolymer transport system component